MRKLKQFLSLVVCVVVLVAVFAGCGNKATTEPGASTVTETTAAGQTAETSAAAADANAEKLEISVAVWGIQDGFSAEGAENDTVFKNLTQKFNVTITPVQVTWNDWNDKIKIWAASNQLPDVFANNLATDNVGLYNAWASQGVIKAMPDDLSKYPTIQQVMSQASVSPLKVNGKFYMYPRMTYLEASDWAMDRAIAYRKDWAKAAGFTSDPNSLDEFIAMCKAVMKQHPGIQGITVNTCSFLVNIAMLGSCPEFSNTKGWVNEDGKWVPGYASKKALEGIKQLRTLYTEGILDKDFSLLKDDEGVQKFMSGKSFACFQGPIGWATRKDIFKQGNPGVNPQDALGYMMVWPAADGSRYTFAETPYWSETFFNAKLEDKKFDRALQILDYMSTDEYISQACNGIEGTDYKIEDGKAVSILPADQTLAKKYPITQNIGYLGRWPNYFNNYSGKKVINSDPDQAYLEQLLVETFKKLKANAKPAPLNFDIMLMSTPAKDKISSLGDTAVKVDIPKIILSKGDPEKLWQDMLKAYDAKGLQDAINEVNAKAAELGIK